MDSGNPAATSCHATTPFSQTQSRCSQKALVRNSGLVKSDIGRITSDDNVATETSLDTRNTMLERFGPQKTIHVEGETVVRSGDVARNEAILSSEQLERPNANDDSSMQPVTRPETEGVASGVAVPATRKRKIVKKIVRVVKKVIKKRVPKRVPMSSSENQGLVEEAGNGVKLNEVTESSNIVRNVVEKSNLVDVVTERTCVLNEVMGRSNITNANLEDRVTKKTITANDVTEKSNIDDRVMETSKVDQAASLLEPIACMKCNDVRDINSVNEEASKLNGGAHVTAPMIDEKGDLRCIMKETSKVNIVARVPHQMVSEKGNYPIANHCVEKADTKSYDALTGVDGKDLNVSNCHSMEVENVSYAPKINTEREITKHISDHVMESASNDSTVVNQNMDIVNKEDVGPVASQNVGLVGNKSVICVGEKNRSTIGNRGSRNTEVANDAVAPNEGLLLSGELEALERKRRRRTEIFVSGLGEETNENDIRKVFEEAGTVTEVRLMTNSKTGKNKGFAFVRFATAADANKALAKYSKVEICGKQCGAAPVQGNDTIYIGNIDRKWKTEDVRCLLEKAGFEKIDMVILKADPNNMEKNRGFAFVEFETSKDAQIAFNKLQKKNLFGKNLKIKVAWAQPLMEPAEEEILKVKSVYAEYLPSSWDEEKVKEYFRRFGEIESIVLAKDLPSSRRKDFAFINYTSRDAALLCIEAIGRERLEDDGSKVKITASLAKPVSKSKQMEHVSSLTSTRLPKKNLKAFQSTAKSYEPRNKGKLAGSSYGQAKVDNSSCMTNELVQILRQQAASSHILPSRNIDTTPPHHHFPLPASKRPFSLVLKSPFYPILQEHDPFYLDPRGLPRQCTGNSYPISGPSASSHGFSMASRPYHHQQALGFTSEPFNWRNMYPSHSQIQEQEAPYYGNYMYRRRKLLKDNAVKDYIEQPPLVERPENKLQVFGTNGESSDAISDRHSSVNSRTKMALEGKKCPKGNFFKYLQMEREGRVLSAEEDLKIERRLAKKLKVKNGKLSAANDDLDWLLEGIPSVLDNLEETEEVTESAEHVEEENEISFEEEDEESDPLSSKADLKLERRLAKKLKVKAGKLGGDDDDINMLLEGVPSVLDSLEGEQTKDPADYPKKSLNDSISDKKLENNNLIEQEQKAETTKNANMEASVRLESSEVASGKNPNMGGGKYVAPHLRSLGNESAEYAQVRKRVRGLLNRLSETNVESITGEISTLFHSVGRSVGSQIITEEVIASCSGGPRGNEQYAAVFAAFTAGMACLVGIDFGAKLLACLAKCFEEEYLKEENLSLRNLTLLFSYLYVFGLCSSELIYDFLIMLGKRLTEVDVSTVLTILQSCGMKLRGDDPVGMKNFILSVQSRVNELKACSGNEQSNISSKRMEFMIETICDIKNNKKRPKEDTVQHTRIKKWLQKLRVDDILIRGLKWSKLLDPSKKGQWWLSGDIASTAENIEEVAGTIDKEIPETKKMLELAVSQRMNTDARRAIFCDREIMRVLVECCLQEKVFNKYYCVLATKLCSHDKNHKFTLQYCLWDHFKELESMPLLRSMHLAKFTAEMVASFSLSLAVLKFPDKLVWNIFTRIAVTPEYEPLRSGIEFFIRKYVVSSQKSLADKFKLARKALNNAEGVVM
ncbi:UNVERIFIED_CONTAM: Nucleolar MIF4G domain-containing protein 1 [Sesamum calycinum]|uniref:Nucleolar MIF4G domain-containing protein 1 n=1 Tax=Sesamum calycinum TaxID=2727403 RepID=A0AAW2NSY6_9LAMI